MTAQAVKAFLLHELAQVKQEAHQLEFDPTTQWKFHRKMSWIWLFQFPFIMAFVLADAYGTLENWDTKILLLMSCLLLSYNTFLSNYANFATEFDAVSAADAARRAQGVEEKVETTS